LATTAEAITIAACRTANARRVILPGNPFSLRLEKDAALAPIPATGKTSSGSFGKVTGAAATEGMGIGLTTSRPAE